MIINQASKNIQSTHNHVFEDLQDYVLSTKNLSLFTKHMLEPRRETINPNNRKQIKHTNVYNQKIISKEIIATCYKPNQKDTLFWCFYILKNGYSKYEMEINNAYFITEKNEKFKYIKDIREKKDILKLHKIKPLSEIEPDLTNSEKINIKSFFSLCILENLNVIVIDKRKYYECIVNDDPSIHVICKDSVTNDYYIELNVSNDKINNYRENYYKVINFDTSLKSISSYKLDDLNELCKKLNIDISKSNENNKKKTKKELYELIVMNF
jgi:hypothetical protein